ncbi:hypothetical protein DRF60_03395 [Chryseobacterium elymi]|uniref:Uncharacterized protein n=1 Tax=Chryseobacterium elymi TaxID=395936 RepID=A0A3D9DPS5_9FLAO|nr:hypothetical protein DRF60_03395 [Chryseobacterium elymi]
MIHSIEFNIIFENIIKSSEKSVIKKLTREQLKTIQGSAGRLCCTPSCANENECASEHNFLQNVHYFQSVCKKLKNAPEKEHFQYIWMMLYSMSVSVLLSY